MTKNTTSKIYLVVSLVSVFFVWHLEAKFGFFPTDESRTLGLTQRLFFKQTPHVDFSYQSFMGSMYLHLYALLVPKYKLAILRIISILMVHGYTLYILRLSSLYNSKNLLLKIFFWISATYLNIHWFDYFIWPTLDSLFIITLGITVTKKNNTLGLLLLGLAPLFKTPFLLSVGAYIVFKNIKNFKISIFIKESIISGLPLLIYLLVTFTSGGFNNLYKETLLSPINWDYWNIWFHRLGYYEKQLILFLFLFIAANYIPLKNPVLKNTLNLIYFLSFFVMLYSLDYTTWGYKPYLNLINLFLIFFIFIKNYENLPDIFEALFVCYILEVGAMMSMSWVYGQWTTGSLLVLIYLYLDENSFLDKKVNLPSKFSIKIGSISLVVFILLSSANVLELSKFRAENIWKSNPGRSVKKSDVDLSYNLNNISDNYGSIFVDKNTFQYLKDIDECLSSINSKNVSIFPDNPVLYYIYELNNPVYLDWYEVGYVGNRKAHYNKMIFNNLSESTSKETYIFLQSYRATRLISEIPYERVSKLNTTPWPDNMENVFEEFYNSLKNTYSSDISTCKSFTVIHINN